MIEAAVREIRQRFAALTPRERAGLACVVAVASIAAAYQTFSRTLGAYDALSEAVESHATARRAYAWMGDAGEQERAGTEAGKVWRWSVVGEGDDAVREDAVARVADSAVMAGLLSPEVIAAPVEGDGAVRGVRLELRSEFDWPAALSFLDLIANGETSIRVIRINVSENGEGASSLDMALSVPSVVEGGR